MNRILKILIPIAIIWLVGSIIMSYIFFNVNLKETNRAYRLTSGVFEPLELKNLPIISGKCVWEGNYKLFYSYGYDHFTMRINNEWGKAKVKGIDDFDPQYVWKGSFKTYYSKGTEQYVLDNETWREQKWNIPSFNGNNVWTDGETIYCSEGSNHYVLKDDHWESAYFDGIFFYGENVWRAHDRKIYYSDGDIQYELVNHKWTTKEWLGCNNFYGKYIWTVGTDYTFYSYGKEHFSLENGMWVNKQWNITDFNGDDIWKDSKEIVYYYGYNAESAEKATKSYIIKESIKEGLLWPKFIINIIL